MAASRLESRPPSRVLFLVLGALMGAAGAGGGWWLYRGGGVIAGAPRQLALVIRQTEFAHRDIEQILQQLARATATWKPPQ